MGKCLLGKLEELGSEDPCHFYNPRTEKGALELK